NIGLERAFLREGVSGQGRALRALRYFYADRGGIGGGDSSGAQHGELRKDFVVDLGDQVILTIGFAAPDLAELNGIDCHRTFPDSRWVCFQTTGVRETRQFPARLPRANEGPRGWPTQFTDDRC